MGIDIPMSFMAGDSNSIVLLFSNHKSQLGWKKNNMIFCSEEFFISLFWTGTKIRASFSTEEVDILAIFSRRVGVPPGL